jgi:hypothetical protein
MKKEVVCCVIVFVVLFIAQVSAFEFCDEGIQGEEELRIISVDDMIKEDGIEWAWQTLGEVELEVRVQNRGEERSNYEIELVFVQDGQEEEIVVDDDNLKKEVELDSGERKSVSFVFEIDEDADKGDYELYVKFYLESDEDEQCVESLDEIVRLNTIEICEDGNVDLDDLEILEIRDESDFDDTWEWGLNSQISIEVDVENKDVSLSDFVVELLLYDMDGQELDFVLNDQDVREDVRIGEDEEEDISFDFEIDPQLEEGSYYLYAKVYAEDDYDICTSLRAEKKGSLEKIVIKREENKIVVSSVDGPKELGLEEKGTYTVNIVNIGNEDEEKVKVILYNRLLGVKSEVEIDSVKSGEEREVVIDFVVPMNHTVESAKILFSTEFEYDEDREIYLKSSEDNDDIKYPITLTQVEGVQEEENDTALEDEVVEDIIGEILEGNVDEEILDEDIFDEDILADSPITGAVVGADKGGNGMTAMIVLIVILCGSFGVFLFYRTRARSGKPYVSDFEDYKVVRRYTAKPH